VVIRLLLMLQALAAEAAEEYHPAEQVAQLFHLISAK